MAAPGLHFHQAVFAVPGVQGEGLPHQNGCGDQPESNAEPLVYTRQVHNHKEYEESQQTAHENEQVLRFQPLELNRLSNPPVDWKLCHTLYYRKKERRIVAATIRKIQAPNHEAAVLLVSGSPEENFP